MARTPEEMDTAITAILTFLGDMAATHAQDKAAYEANPSKPEGWMLLPNGDWPLAQNVHMLREWQNQHANISGQIAALEARPTVPPPSSVEPINAATLAKLLADNFDIHVAKDPETGRPYLSIGMTPDFANQAPFQLGPKVAGEIAAYKDTLGTPGGTPGSAEVGCNTMVIRDGDGGMRWRQYGHFGKAGFKRNTGSRPFTVLAMDSMGNVCQSQVPAGATADGGQNWYIITEWGRKLVRFVTFKAGWKPTVEACSTKYADADIKLL